jgi:hypothetical protein
MIFFVASLLRSAASGFVIATALSYWNGCVSMSQLAQKPCKVLAIPNLFETMSRKRQREIPSDMTTKTITPET